jgi:hypothetical protein
MPPLAYPLYGPDNPLPYKRNTYYRWERLGLIKLIRVGGRTMISAEDVTRILSGKVEIAPHSSRKHRPEPNKRTGRPRKVKEQTGRH